jgi:hypothetical protein
MCKFVYVLQELDGNWLFLRTQRKSEKIQETTILAKDFIGAVGSIFISLPDGLFFSY